MELSLSDKGESVLKSSGFINMFEDHRDEILRKIKDSKPHTKYDVQENATNIVMDLKDEDYMRPIKDYAYQKEESVEEILFIGGIYARDRYFEMVES